MPLPAEKEITVLLPAGLHKRLKLYACQRDRRLKDTLADAVREFLRQQVKK